MKRQYLLKRVLGVILSIALVVGMITISEPNRVQASDTENLIANGGFETTEGWINDSDSSNPVAVQEQQNVAVTEPNYVTYQDFENESDFNRKWRNQSPSTGTWEHVTDTDNADNQVLKYMSSGNTTFDFNNGDVQIFEKGKTYTLSFKYKTDVSFHAYHAGIDSGWNTYAPWVDISASWKTMTCEITPNDSLGCFQIGFQPQGVGTIYIDDFTISCGETEKVTEVTHTVFESGFDATDELPKIQSNPGAFEIDTTEKKSGAGSLKLSYTNAWAQGGLGNFELKAGITYTISYDWKIQDLSGTPNAYSRLVNTSDIWTGLVLSPFQTSETDWTTVTYTYTPSENITAAIYMEVGGGTGTIYLDNLSVSCTTTEKEYVYTEGIGTCLDAEPDNVLVMKGMTKVTYPATIQSGKTYEYSFAVKTDATGNDFEVGFGAGENAIWNHNSESESITDWNTISGTFTATSDVSSIRFNKTGEGIVFLDDVVLKERAAVQPELQSVELSFDNYNGGWYFTVDDISKIESGHYKVPIKIDDNATADVIIEYPQSWYPNGLAIWEFTNFGGTTPTTSFEIAENAVMAPIDVNTGVEDTSRNSVVISNTLRVVYTGGVWQEYKAPEPTPPELPTIDLGYKMVEVDNSWYFTSSNISDVTGSYYKTTVKVDDTEFEVPLEKTADGFVIWVNFFGLIDTTKQAPTTKLEIEKDTLLQQIDPNTTGWSTAVEGGQTLKIAEDLVVVKTDTGWEVEGEQTPPDGPGQDEPTEPIVVALGNAMGIYNPGTENEVFSVMISGPDEIKTADITATGILKADGSDNEHVVYFPGNGEVFFYTDGARETLLIDKDTEFVAQDGKTVIQFDKDYEIDLINQVIYEQGKKPVEKNALDLTIAFDKIVNDSFMFTWMMDSNQKPEAGFYRADAVIDGEETEVLIEYFASDNAFFIYPHCFNGVPVDGREGYPTESFELKEGTELTPVVKGTWAKNTEGQPYKLTSKVSVVKEGESWLDADYMEEISKQEPLEVKIVFDCVKGSAAIFKVVLPNGKEIDDIYGDWTTARGVILRGVAEADAGNYSYTSEIAAYSITGNMFYMDGLRLHELDALQIDAGTILYADATCNSTQPIKITNQVRLIRDANDEWVIDKTFTTEYNLVAESETVSDNQNKADSSEEQKDVVSEQKEEIIASDKEDKNYKATNIRYHDETEDEEANSSVQENNILILAIGITSGVLLAALCILLIIANKKRKDKQEQGE